jgi:nickel/cobalt transporter (NiCoT) family protein
VETFPESLPALLVLALVLGMKHGMDADHLATIDGLTRFNARRPRLARWCGALFSLGHGAVVIAFALVVGAASRAWAVPLWLEAIGAWISIGFLAALGLVNLQAVMAASPDEMVRPLGLKAGLFGRLQRVRHPLVIASVGALFAISFDTVSQAGLIAVTATHFGGFAHALALALLFTLGMLLVDGLNGLWIARLLRRADERARSVSRAMGLAIASLSLALAGWSVIRQFSPRLEVWGDGKELAFGVGMVACVLATFLVALAIRRLANGFVGVSARGELSAPATTCARGEGRSGV